MQHPNNTDQRTAEMTAMWTIASTITAGLLGAGTDRSHATVKDGISLFDEVLGELVSYARVRGEFLRYTGVEEVPLQGPVSGALTRPPAPVAEPLDAVSAVAAAPAPVRPRLEARVLPPTGRPGVLRDLNKPQGPRKPAPFSGESPAPPAGPTVYNPADEAAS